MKKKSHENKLTNYLYKLALHQALMFLVMAISTVLLRVLIVGVFQIGEDQDLTGVSVIASIVTFIILMMLMYSSAWNYGFKDVNPIKLGYKPANKKRGVYSALFAQIPGGIILLVYLIAYIFNAPFLNGARVVWEFLYSTFYWLFAIVRLIPWLYLLCFVLAPAASFCGYRNGINNYGLAHKLVYSDPNRTANREKDRRFR